MLPKLKKKIKLNYLELMFMFKFIHLLSMSFKF